MNEWVAALMAVATGLGGLVTGWLTWRRREKTEAEKTAIAQYQALLDEERRRRREDVDEVRRQLHQHGEQLEQDQRFIDALFDDNGDCHTSQQLQYAWMKSADGWMRMAVAAIRTAGREVPEPPALPPRPKSRLPRDRAEFLARSSRQGAVLLKENDSRVLPPPKGGPP